MRAGLVLALMCLLPCCAAPRPGAAIPPASYRFAPGLQLTYVEHATDEGQGMHGETETRIDVVVVGAAGPGAYEVLAFVRGEEPSEPVWAVITADGQAAGAWSEDAAHVLAELLPPLPEPRGGSVARGSYRYGCTPLSADPGEFAWRAHIEDPLARVYEVEEQCRFRFDLARGVIAQAEASGRQAYGFRHAWRSNMTLEGTGFLPAPELETLRRELAAFRARRDEAERALAEAGGPAARPFDVEALRREGAASSDRRMRDAYLALADRVEETLAGVEDAPAIGQRMVWSDVPDLDGRSHSLDAYAGRVVVLDFWYRGCGYCMKGMPILQRFESDVAGSPVTVLSVSIDRQREDAALVRSAMGIDHPVLLGRQIAEVYGVQACPTIIVLGPDGTVRDVAVGYREGMNARLKGAVARALAGPG